MKFNRNSAAVIGILVTLVFGGAFIFRNSFSVFASSSKNFQQTEITKEQARKIALEKVKGTIVEEEFEKENGRMVYGFEIREADGNVMEVKIDAETGKIIFVGKDDGDSDENGDDDDDDDESPEVRNARIAELTKEAGITMEQAKTFALSRVPGTITEEDLERENGVLHYSFDIRDANGKVFDVEVDAKNGQILKAAADTEDEDDDDDDDNVTTQQQASLAQSAQVKKAQAEVIALNRIPGEIIKTEIERENGKLFWGFDIRDKNGKVFEVEVDANTGQIIKAQEESADEPDDDGDNDSMS